MRLISSNSGKWVTGHSLKMLKLRNCVYIDRSSVARYESRPKGYSLSMVNHDVITTILMGRAGNVLMFIPSFRTSDAVCKRSGF